MRPLPGPFRGRALGVEVRNEGPAAAHFRLDSHMQGDRRFSGSALSRQHG